MNDNDQSSQFNLPLPGADYDRSPRSYIGTPAMAKLTTHPLIRFGAANPLTTHLLICFGAANPLTTHPLIRFGAANPLTAGHSPKEKPPWPENPTHPSPPTPN